LILVPAPVHLVPQPEADEDVPEPVVEEPVEGNPERGPGENEAVAAVEEVPEEGNPERGPGENEAVAAVEEVPDRSPSPGFDDGNGYEENEDGRGSEAGESLAAPEEEEDDALGIFSKLLMHLKLLIF
jgi:hypothetical protein